MLPRVLSVIGVLLILFALAGLLYGSSPPAPRSSGFLLGEGGGPPDANANAGNSNADSGNVNGNTSGNLNAKAGDSNANRGLTPTPRPSPTPPPTPQPTPRPTQQPTPEPTRQPTPRPTPPPPDWQRDEVLRSRVLRELESRGLGEGQLRRRGLAGVRVFVSGGRVTLDGEVPDGMLDDVSAAVRAAGALGVENRVRAVGRSVPAPVNSNRRRRPAPAGPARTPPPELFFDVRADEPELSKIEVEWPETLGVNDTRTVRVTVINEVAPSSVPVTDIPGDRAERLDPHACYPKNTSLRKAYPNYEATATAKLVAANFDAQLSGEETKSLDADRVTWLWNVKPRGGGSHTLSLTVTAQWKHRQKALTKPPCEIFGRSFKVGVEEKWLSEGNLKTAQAVVGLLGVFLQLPIFIWWRKRGQAEGKKGPEGEEKEAEKKE
jgi:hypothetical protein